MPARPTASSSTHAVLRTQPASTPPAPAASQPQPARPPGPALLQRLHRPAPSSTAGLARIPPLPLQPLLRPPRPVPPRPLLISEGVMACRPSLLVSSPSSGLSCRRPILWWFLPGVLSVSGTCRLFGYGACAHIVAFSDAYLTLSFPRMRWQAR